MTQPTPSQNVRIEPPTTATTGDATASPAATAPEETTGGHHGQSSVRRAAQRTKQVLLIVLGALIAAFAISNSQDVRVRWIFGDPVDVPLIAVIAITLAVSFAIGWLAAKLGARRAD